MVPGAAVETSSTMMFYHLIGLHCDLCNFLSMDTFGLNLWEWSDSTEEVDTSPGAAASTSFRRSCSAPDVFLSRVAYISGGRLHAQLLLVDLRQSRGHHTSAMLLSLSLALGSYGTATYSRNWFVVLYREGACSSSSASPRNLLWWVGINLMKVLPLHQVVRLLLEPFRGTASPLYRACDLSTSWSQDFLYWFFHLELVAHRSGVGLGN